MSAEVPTEGTKRRSRPPGSEDASSSLSSQSGTAGPSGARWGVLAHSPSGASRSALCVQATPNHAVSGISLCAYISQGPLVPPRPAKSRATPEPWLCRPGGRAPSGPRAHRAPPCCAPTPRTQASSGTSSFHEAELHRAVAWTSLSHPPPPPAPGSPVMVESLVRGGRHFLRCARCPSSGP